jgi:hypothetical protein
MKASFISDPPPPITQTAAELMQLYSGVITMKSM